jgi:hypothetical protein
MSYRDVRDYQRAISELQNVVDAAILSQDTRDISTGVTHIMARANDVRVGLERTIAVGGNEGAGEPRLDRRFLQAALSSVSRFVADATKVQLGNNPDEMRQRLLFLKTGIDHADAYLRAALGTETV